MGGWILKKQFSLWLRWEGPKKGLSKINFPLIGLVGGGEGVVSHLPSTRTTDSNPQITYPKPPTKGSLARHTHTDAHARTDTRIPEKHVRRPEICSLPEGTALECAIAASGDRTLSPDMDPSQKISVLPG